MNSVHFPVIYKKAKRPVIAVASIVLVCLMMLVSNRSIFGLARKPLSSEVLYATEIDGSLNYIENRNGITYFSVREQVNQLFGCALKPLSANSNFDFYKNAITGDFIHKPGDSDTVILIRNKARYYYATGK